MIRWVVGLLMLGTLGSSQGANAEQAEAIFASIRHQCIVDCVRGRKYCESQSKKGCEVLFKQCTPSCLDPKAIKTAQKEKVSATWGSAKADAIEVCLPGGEHQFLSQLRCPNSQPPQFERSGSVGSRNPRPKDLGAMDQMDPNAPVPKGQIDCHIIDRYSVRCGSDVKTLHFDMYHCYGPKPWAAPKGFTRPPTQQKARPAKPQPQP